MECSAYSNATFWIQGLLESQLNYRMPAALDAFPTVQ